MNTIQQTLLVGAIVLVTHGLESITGFGCTVLALPFIAMVLGIRTAVPLLVVLAWFLAGYIVIRSRRAIQGRVFLFILLHAAIGLPLGIWLFDYLPEKSLKLFLSLVMISVGGQGLARNLRAAPIPPSAGQVSPSFARPSVCLPENGIEFLASEGAAKMPCALALGASPSGWLMRGVLVLAGVIHGAFGAGGPLVVIYASRVLTEKTLFRVTLCMLWLCLNTLLIFKWTWAGGVWNRQVAIQLAVALPFLAVGMIAGDCLHQRVNERFFRILVYAVLILAGVVLLLAPPS